MWKLTDKLINNVGLLQLESVQYNITYKKITMILLAVCRLEYKFTFGEN